MEAWIVPLAFWAFLGAIIIAPMWLRSRERERFYDTVRAAFQSGAPAPPEWVEQLKAHVPADAGIPAPERDMRRGVVLLAAGLGMVGLGAGLWFGLMPLDDYSAWESGGWVGGVGFIVALLGLVYLAFWLARRGRPPRRA
ncbi:MAG TPA: DUF6249 domain-containing protein [Caulobacteraceae bacterium]|nr:DUF6249 domain-containing protein [Caulobacteraceae bacterium]